MKNEKPAFFLDSARLGCFGEEMAAAEYRRRHFDVLFSDYSSPFGEIDLILCKKDLIVYAEVRTRRTGAMVTPAETVDRAKQKKLIATAHCFLAAFPELQDFDMRFDVVEVFYQGEYRYTIHVIENAFDLSAF